VHHITMSLVLCATVAVSSLSAGTKTDFLVNNDGAAVEHSQPRITVIPGKGFAIAWSDYRSGNRDIYIQRFTLNGDALGSNQIVNDDTNHTYQSGPALGIDGSGNYAIVWQDYRDGSYPFGPHIYFQRYDSALTQLGTNRNISIEKPDSLKELPDMACDIWGRGVVVWADYRNRNWDIYGQIIAPNGAPIGVNFRINDDNGTAQQHAPRVSISNDGWAVVTWYDNRIGNDDIFVQRIDSLGHKLGVNVKVNSDVGTTRQAYPDIAADGAGHFTVVWTDWRNGTYPSNPDIYARKFDTSMTPITSDARVNADVSVLAQRDPAIAADRLGNVSIVWSDSSASSWDVSGEMIDVTGVIREINFRANSTTDSAQLQPDVALDGRNRYVTWVDKRSGQFNIYASIETYNNPTLAANPSQIRMAADISGQLPTTNLIVNHAGYNKLHFRVKSSVPWIAVTPSTGQTVDTVSVAVIQSLTYGAHYATLTLVDDDNHDSTVTVPVRVDITAPVLTVTPSVLSVATFKGVRDTIESSISIENTGTGTIAWTAVSTAPWLTVSPSSGTAPSSLVATLNAATLDTGTYDASLIVQGAGAVNSPDTVPVQFQVVSNRPYLKVTPDSIHISILDTLTPLHPTLLVTNPGVGTINWTAQSPSSWITLGATSGVAGDSIPFTFQWSALAEGRNVGSLVVTDSNSFNQTAVVPVVLDWLTVSTDTIIVGAADCMVGDTVSVPLTLNLNAAVSDLDLPINFEDTLLHFDSFALAPSLVGHYQIHTASSPGRGSITLAALTASDSISAGSPVIGRLYFHADTLEGLATITEDGTSGSMAQLRTRAGVWGRPTVLPGQVNIGARTDIGENQSPNLPMAVTLLQNYPNPFNATTVINFGLPRADNVRLEIYNILGQQIAVPVDRQYPAGWHQINWPAGESIGLRLSSGVYFYRLQAGSTAIVRKLVLLK
jgi:hypothetical protein